MVNDISPVVKSIYIRKKTQKLLDTVVKMQNLQLLYEEAVNSKQNICMNTGVPIKIK